jgi:hypothetical protein
MLDFNSSLTKARIADGPINEVIDFAILDRSLPDPTRNYVGASAIGHECLRRIQFDWRHPWQPEARTKRIFDRGHWFESYAVQLLRNAGFMIWRDPIETAFEQLDGKFAGHADGIILSGPEISGVGYPCLWECKGLGSKGWNKLYAEKLAKAYPAYTDQVAVYQAYLDLIEHPAIFTAGNLDTMEILHRLVPFDAERAQRASDRAVTVIRGDAAGEVLPRIAADPNDWRCRFCPHRDRCWNGEVTQ